MDLQHCLHCLHWLHLEPTHPLYSTVCTGYTWSLLTLSTTLSALATLGAHSPRWVGGRRACGSQGRRWRAVVPEPRAVIGGALLSVSKGSSITTVPVGLVTKPPRTLRTQKATVIFAASSIIDSPYGRCAAGVFVWAIGDLWEGIDGSKTIHTVVRAGG
jgi:hypothetical protein